MEESNEPKEMEVRNKVIYIFAFAKISQVTSEKQNTEEEESELLDQDQGNSSSQNDAETAEKKLPYPKSVFFIVSNEFCERFSFYGMRTVLSLYLKNVLDYSESDAKILYHMFIFFVYFFPVFGAILADSWLGKFKTIFYVSIVYCIGNIVLALASATPLNIPQVEFSLIGLLLIAIGTGGIKPCVAAFGGDQFTLPQQEMQLAKFFSMFYFAINAGSLISTLLTPILRENVHCFGEQSCYPLAFGIPGILMIVSIIVFVLGKRMYIIKKPTGNIIVRVSKCIGHAVVTKVKSKGEKKSHWLDYASDKYDDQLINDIKATLKVLFLYIPIPVFWALYDQQGTGWTFQASRMSGDIGFYTILPDQMQVVNPILILAFIPLFDTCIYPLLNKCRVLRTPLQRLTMGGILAAVAFILSALVELQLEGTYPVLPNAHQAQLRMYNGLPCRVQIIGLNTTAPDIEINPFQLHYEKLEFESNHFNMQYKVKPADGCGKENANLNSIVFSQTVEEKQMIAHFIRYNHTVKDEYEVFSFKDDVEKSSNGYPLVRTLVGLPPGADNLPVVYKGGSVGDLKLNTTDKGVMHQEKIAPDTYTLYVNDSKMGVFDFQLGGVYSVFVSFDNKTSTMYTISEPNSVHILWLIPQYVVMTLGEIMFSVTGLEFSYSQAPLSMKSVLQAGWLLTTAFGNLIVIIIEEASTFDKQSKQYFLYAGIMVTDMVVFAIVAMRYKYVKKPGNEVEEEEQEEIAMDEPKEKLKSGNDNKSFENENLK